MAAFALVTSPAFAANKEVRVCGFLTTNGYTKTTYLNKYQVSKKYSFIFPASTNQPAVKRYNVVLKEVLPSIWSRVNWWMCVTARIYHEPADPSDYGLMDIQSYQSDMTNGEAGIE